MVPWMYVCALKKYVPVQLHVHRPTCLHPSFHPSIHPSIWIHSDPMWNPHTRIRIYFRIQTHTCTHTTTYMHLHTHTHAYISEMILHAHTCTYIQAGRHTISWLFQQFCSQWKRTGLAWGHFHKWQPWASFSMPCPLHPRSSWNMHEGSQVRDGQGWASVVRDGQHGC